MSKIVLDKFGIKETVSVDMRNRSSVLRDLEGWFEVPVILDSSTESLYNEYLQANTSMKFTKWLTKVKQLNNTVISEIGRNIKTTSVKLSCKFSDLTRLGETKHYISCMRQYQSYGKQQLKYIADPDVAVLYIPDASGKYIWRSIIRLVVDDNGEYCLVCYKPYGNGPSAAILKTLSCVSKMRVLPALRIGLAKSKGVLMFSPTKHNNVFASGNYYADHQHEFDKKSRRIGIYVEDNSITNSDVEKEHGEQMLAIDRIVSSALMSPFLHVSGCVA